jgi:hypothetical protein
LAPQNNPENGSEMLPKMGKKNVFLEPIFMKIGSIFGAQNNKNKPGLLPKALQESKDDEHFCF